MKEPSSQKSSEPDDPSGGNGGKQEKPQVKLKLKPLVPTTDQESADALDNSSKSSLDKNQARLKLKHLMSPLSPHLQKVRDADKQTSRYQPTVRPPSAEPIEEPGVDEIPPGANPLAEPVPPPAAQPISPPPDSGVKPEGKTATQPVQMPMGTHIKPEDTAKPEKPAAAKATKTEKLVSAPKKKSRLLKVSILAVNLLIILLAVQYFFDPLGLKIEPFEHTAPVLPEVKQDEPIADAIANAIAPIESYDDLESISMESFVDKLGEARIAASNSPKGVIINSIFYPVGSSLHPLLSIKVESVEITGNESILRLVDAEGNEYEYTAN